MQGMVDWNDVRFVLEASRAGTLAKAAERLGVDATTVGRRIGTLEKELGESLLHRGPQGLFLSDAGRAVVGIAENMESLALHLEGLAGETIAPRVAGTVTIAASEPFARTLLVPALGAIRQRLPDLDLVLTASNRLVDLSRGEADLGVRIDKPGAGALVVRQLGQLHAAPYASLDYLGRHAPPADGLAGHDVISYHRELRDKAEARWLAKHAADARVTFRSDSVSLLVSACVAGFGIALLPRHIADGEPTLRRVDGLAPVAPKPLWIVARRSALKTARVRAVFDFLVAERARLVGLPA